VVSLNHLFAQKNKLPLFAYVFILAFFMIIEYRFLISSVLENKNFDYWHFANSVALNLPIAGNVCVASWPDPYFALIKNPNLKVYEFLETPFLEKRKLGFLNKCDWVIVNIALGEPIVGYVAGNREVSISIGSKRGYFTEMTKLKPVEMRR
jgi:hypothetical protein